MPEQVSTGQKGSVLAGVIALSLVMTLAAAGLVTMATNTAVTEIESGRDLQLHHAAEAGAHLGVLWTRTYDSVSILDSDWPSGPNPFTITTGDGGWETLNGFLVKVELIPLPAGGAGAGAAHLLRVTAKDGVNRGILTLEWDIVDASGPIGPYLSTPDLANWTETYDGSNI